MLRWIGTITCMLALISCRQDFDITSEYIEIPVVYGLLDREDTTHYVRIQRAFVDTNTSALTIAPIFDSIYYPDVLDVTITDDSTDKVFRLERVIGDTIGLPKDPGLFNNEANVLYRFEAPLDIQRSYTLEVHHWEKGWTIQSQTTVVGPVVSIVPNAQYVVNWKGELDELIGLAWRRAENAMVYDLQAYFDYWEYPKDNRQDSTLYSIPFTILQASVANLIAPDFIITHSYAPRVFYQELGAQIPFDTTVVRRAKQVRFVLSAGGEALGMWVANQQVQQGVTAGNNLDVYTNIDGGTGLFSSRSTVTFYNAIGGTLRDSLRLGQFTNTLGFLP